jgi:Ni,Fe-hydrogenase III large subunit
MTDVLPLSIRALADLPLRRLGPGVGLAELPATAELGAIVHALAAEPGVRLADLFGAAGPPVTLQLVYALDAEQHYLVLRAPVTGQTYPALSEIDPAAWAEECELFEQHGIRPAGTLLNRVAVAPHAGGDGLWRGAADLPSRQVHHPHTVGGQAFEFPVGPVRAVGVESLYTGLVTSGEEVVELYLFTWDKHRGVEQRLLGMAPADALFLVERVEGLSAVGNGWAFAAAVESAAGVEIPGAVARSRACALELERIYNHAAAVAALCQSTGLSVGQAQAEIVLERFLRINAAVFGHRYLFGVLSVGGVARAADLDTLQKLLHPAYDELRRVTDALLSTNSFLDRLEATGLLGRELSERLALIGPVARASGLGLDARHDHPVAPYDAFPCRPARRANGDALARMQVMRAEVDDSVRLLDLIVDEGVAVGTAEIPAGPGIGLGWAESSRGESLAWVSLDANGRIDQARLRPAAVRNWRAFDDAVRAQNVFTDVPIIEASFWLTVAGGAR